MNQGDVEIQIGDDTITLRSTLGAAKQVNSTLGNYTEAYRRVIAFDFAAYVTIVSAGTGKTPKEVEGFVYRAGMPDLVRPITDYLGLLSNGGRPPAVETGDAPKGEA